MSETNTAQQAAETVETVEVKTFTQEEVNAMISERVKRERAKYEGFDVLKERRRNLTRLRRLARPSFRNLRST
jgi:hypothetical protein